MSKVSEKSSSPSGIAAAELPGRKRGGGEGEAAEAPFPQLAKHDAKTMNRTQMAVRLRELLVLQRPTCGMGGMGGIKMPPVNEVSHRKSFAIGTSVSIGKHCGSEY